MREAQGEKIRYCSKCGSDKLVAKYVKDSGCYNCVCEKCGFVFVLVANDMMIAE